VRCEQLAQSRPPALADLAVLLARPAQLCAQGLGVDIRQLRTDNEALIPRESSRGVPDAAKVVACDDERLHGRPRVGDLDSAIAAIGERGGILQRRLQRAASAERPAAIAHAREEAQLDCVCDVQAICKRGTCAGAGNQLEGRLAVAVFEILQSQTMAVDAKQQLAPGARDDCDLLGRIGCAPGARSRRVATPSSCLQPASGRHMNMSLAIARSPPAHFRRATGQCVAISRRAGV
jgi:hypothetical protein